MIPIVAEMEAIGSGLAAIAFFGFLAIVERRKVELAHVERMRRLDAGLPDPPLDRAWPRALVCMAIGLGVPFAAFCATLIAYLNRKGMAEEAWIVPGVVSVVSVMVAGRLARLLLGKETTSDRHAESVASPAPAAKPVQDSDLFDVVGRRG